MSATQGFNWSTWGLGLLAVTFVGLAAWGEAAKETNRARAAQQQGLQEAAVSKPELSTVQADFTGARALGSVESTSGRNPQLYRLWTALETKDYMFLNGQYGAATCARALDYYASKLPAVNFSPAAMDVALSALEGKKAVVGAYIPRFSHEPDLRNCLGYHYDAEQKVLKVGARTVAFIGPDQPGLALSAK